MNNTKHVASTLIKPYLKKFILQIHPDFFQHDIIKKQHNAQTLQELYGILNPILSTSSPTVVNSNKIKEIIKPIQVSFYKKQQQQQQLILLEKKQKKQKNKKGNDKIKQEKKEIITSSFSDPNQVWCTVQQFLTLCQQADIEILKSDQEAVQSMIQQQIIQQNKNKKGKPISLEEEFAKAFYNEEMNKKLKKRNDILWTKELILNEKLCMYDPNIKEMDQFINQLILWLPKLQPEKWWGKIPTLFLSSSTSNNNSNILNKLDPNLTKDVFILYDNMTFDDISKYIEQHLKLRKQ